MDGTYDKTLVLYCSVHEHVTRIPYLTRFTESYAKRLRGKIWYKILPSISSYNDFLFLTLTINHSHFAC
jgi:hypothetical protein